MTSIDALLHVHRPLKSGGEVTVLDTGALIGPESQAMLGAMYSRSSDGFRVLIEKLRTRGPEQFLKTHYVGYGHKSIGDLGDTAIFIDGISMLGAKAIQDFALYRGQESSTRYIDFSRQRFYNPYDGETKTGLSETVLEAWRQFYLKGRDALIPLLVQRYPRNEGEKEEEYEKAIKAHSFDIMRSFLPAGAQTGVVWVGDLRHIRDHLYTLRNHPLPEVREVANTIEDALLEKFSSSFSKKRYEASEDYYRKMGITYGYFHRYPEYPDFELSRDAIDLPLLAEYREAFETRPEKTELPFSVRECGTMRFRFLLDFGSFRDLQRHRAVVMPMPLVTSEHGFEEWYLAQLPEGFREQAEEFIEQQMMRLHRLAPGPLARQYYLPMGMKTSIRMTGDLRALVYLTELRATRFVHPTLRKRAQQIANTLMTRLEPYGLRLHLDADPNRFDVKRGTHDIIEKS